MGVDLSEEMLMEAREKCPDVMLVQQDITKLRLIEPVDVMIALCDTMNYLTEPELLQQAFHSVRRYLTRDGIFIFDLKTEYCFNRSWETRPGWRKERIIILSGKIHIFRKKR